MVSGCIVLMHSNVEKSGDLYINIYHAHISCSAIKIEISLAASGSRGSCDLRLTVSWA